MASGPRVEPAVERPQAVGRPQAADQKPAVRQRVHQALRQLPRDELARLAGTLLAAWHSAETGEEQAYEVTVHMAAVAQQDGDGA